MQNFVSQQVNFVLPQGISSEVVVTVARYDMLLFRHTRPNVSPPKLGIEAGASCHRLSCTSCICIRHHTFISPPA